MHRDETLLLNTKAFPSEPARPALVLPGNFAAPAFGTGGCLLHESKPAGTGWGPAEGGPQPLGKPSGALQSDPWNSWGLMRRAHKSMHVWPANRGAREPLQLRSFDATSEKF
jgi:hypothetical protein